MKFEFSAHGKRSLKKLDQILAQRILKKLAYWESTGSLLKYAEKLEGADDLLKYRVGHYRIIAWPHFEKDMMMILKIDNRDHIYDSLEKFL